MTRLPLPLTAIVLALSSPAFAQADGPICGGISLVGEWVGGSPETSDLAVSETVFDADGQVPIAGHLVRMFTLSESAPIRVDVAAVPGGDPYIAIYDEAGAEVAQDDDSGGNFASRIDTVLDAGTYCLAARSYSSGLTDITVRLSHSDLAPEDEVPDQATPPVSLDGLGAGCGSPDLPALLLGSREFATVNEHPAWALIVEDGVPLTITASSDFGDPLVRVRDATGDIWAENDDADGLNSRIDLADPMPPGEYCLEVEDLNGDDNVIAIAVEAFDPAAERLRSLNMAEFAPLPDDDVTITDLGPLSAAILRDIEATSDAQWYRFTLPEGGLLVTEAISPDGLGDPVVTLFDRVGRRIGENDDGPDGLDSFLVTRVLPGDYILAVRLVEEGASAPIRVLLERYIPAP